MSRLHPLAAASAAWLLSVPAFADPAPESEPSPVEVAATGEAATELETIVVSGQRTALPPDLPGASSGVTGTQLRERVFINTEDALRYLPDVSIRKRYIGDRNALIGGRDFGTLQAPRGVVYADGVLLSNFLGRFNAPRWNMVAPEEISRVDVLYGPFSALYPGNSIGTTVLITTRDPDQLAASGRVQAFTQSYEGYGYRDDYGGRQYSAFAGDRRGRWSGTFSANRLDNKSQPMQYATATPCANCQGTPVTGAIVDTDPRGMRRVILGPDGGSIEHDGQTQLKGKVAYESAWLRVDGQLGWWRNDYDRHGVSFLRDAAGMAVTRGVIEVDGSAYTVSNAAFGPQEGAEEHLMSALTARTRFDGGWNASTVVSLYDIHHDLLHASVPDAAGSTKGTLTDNSGTGWWNADVQATHRSDASAHAITLGYYHSRYDLESERFGTADWHGTDRAELQDGSFGSTRLQAVYAQDAWHLHPAWTATVGARLERWEAYDGRRRKTNASSGDIDTARYRDRDKTDVSPKLSIAYAPSDWTLRYSIARGVRYPTVSELFQGSQNVDQIVNNNPDLKAEDAFDQDLTFETRIAARHDVRVSLFRNVVDDTIFQQTSVLNGVNNIQNVDRVVSNGVELVYGVRDLLPTVDLDANLALVDSTIEKNRNVPASEHQDWVRVPKVRANLVANWRFLPGWNANVAARRSGPQHNELDNSDVHRDRFGGTSAFTTVDARVGYRFRDHFDAAFGVENLTGEHYYVFHPYPGRTFVAELRGSF